jgi:hypothetical protein
VEGWDRWMWSPVNPQPEQLPIGESVPEDLFRPQLGEPHHYAYVVDDVEATVSRLVDQLGAGPFFLIDNVPLETCSRAVSRRNSFTTPPLATAAAARSS